MFNHRSFNKKKRVTIKLEKITFIIFKNSSFFFHRLYIYFVNVTEKIYISFIKSQTYSFQRTLTI